MGDIEMQNGSVVLEPFRWAHDPAVAFCRPCRDVLFNEDSNGVLFSSGGAKLAELGWKPDWSHLTVLTSAN